MAVSKTAYAVAEYYDIYTIMTKSEMQSRIRILKNELNTRHKYGIAKIASPNGEPVSVEKLQEELYSLIYKDSKME